MATTTSRELPQSTLNVLNTVSLDYMVDMIASLRALEDRNQLMWDFGQFETGRQTRQHVDAMVGLCTIYLEVWGEEMSLD